MLIQTIVGTPLTFVMCCLPILMPNTSALPRDSNPSPFMANSSTFAWSSSPPAPELKLRKEETLILAAVRRCKIEAKNDLDMHYYRKEGGIEVVDMSTIQCLVGRLQTTDKKHWVVIDRSGDLARPYYDPDDSSYV
ncbi:hypothetical protein MVEN_01137000 [Mycena venus]|uniref:Uncharacterized protein n=1 Tax=Mycena venus TaxID=2733690 RepID=A0A8H7D0S0_9AGAR|nr:hypothetical protein MVEN_01137000 [Mycena venus]